MLCCAPSGYTIDTTGEKRQGAEKKDYSKIKEPKWKTFKSGIA